MTTSQTQTDTNTIPSEPIRRQEPHLQQKQKPRTLSSHTKYKEYTHTFRVIKTPSPYVPYSERPKGQLASNRIATNRYLREMRLGKTSKMRTRLKARNRKDQRYRALKRGDTKLCTHCLELKAITDFDLQCDKSKDSATRRPYCRSCRKKENAEAYQKRKNT